VRSPFSLRQRVTVAVLGYAILLSIGIGIHGYVVNERAEAVVWESMLRSELAHYETRRASDPNYRWTNTDALMLMGQSAAEVPPELHLLPAGVHDELQIGNREYVALVSGTGAERMVLALDISQMERDEHRLLLSLVISSAIVVAILVLVTHFGAGVLLKPLTSIARSISTLRPNHGGQRVELEANAPEEAVVIANALNDYLVRIDQFVERERAFLNMASHELRTPIAVIAGAAEVALDRNSLSEPGQRQLQHILRTARDMEELVAMLLALAKDPSRLHASNTTLDLAQVVRSVVDDHRFLAKDKELTFSLQEMDPQPISAPPQILRATLGNLVRNAIENSNRGDIRISISTPLQVVIEDPGHGMSAEELSRIYSRMARTGEGTGSGIGIDLIARVCEQLGWKLQFESQPGKGTVVRLAFTR
jgi:signal transduction histidine kinase